MNSHKLKIWPETFAAVKSGAKRYEIRKDDRGFAVGDHLALFEYEPDAARYTGRGVIARVTHKTPGGEWGLPAEVCVMSIEVFCHLEGIHDL